MAELLYVEIFSKGTWVGSMGPMKWTSEDIEEIVMNTNALMTQGKLKPKLKFGHSEFQFWEEAQVLEGQDDGDPSIGTAYNFKVSGDKIICDFRAVPDIVYNCIKAEMYDSVSAELSYIQNFGWFISAVSLLGADAPAVKGLADLQAFLSQANTENSEFVLKFSQPSFKGEHMPGENNQPKPAAGQASDLTVAHTELQTKFSDMQSKLQASDSKLEEQAKELQKYKEQAIENDFQGKLVSATATYKQDVKDGKLMPAMLQKIEDHFKAQRASFSEGSSLTISPELVGEITQSYRETLDTTQQGGGGGDLPDSNEAPDEVFAMEVKKIQAEHPKMSYKQASDHLSLVKPAVFKEYSEWVTTVSNKGRIQ